MNIVTIMNYPLKDKNYVKMCKIWLDRVIKHGGDNVIVYYHTKKPEYLKDFATKTNLSIEKGVIDKKTTNTHFNARFKLPTLAAVDVPFIFIDADAYVIHDLDFLWKHKKDKPWIGMNHQTMKQHPETQSHMAWTPFLNSGVQIVSDPKFYSLEKIKKFQSKTKNRPYQYVPGVDQSILFKYFKHIGYDYTHPKIGTEWNSCSILAKLKKDKNGIWSGNTETLNKNHPIYINHYWWKWKPWEIKCPIHKSYDF
jgi:hypothetical protein